MNSIASILRCPRCSGVNFDNEGQFGTPSGGPLVCRSCGYAIRWRDGIVHALPTELDAKSAANLDYYDAIADREGSDLDRRVGTRNHERKLRTILEALELHPAPPARRVVEFGAGFCAHGQAVKRMGHEYIALDISPANLRQARRLYPLFDDTDLCAADAMNAPFQDECFDAGYYVGALHHVPDPERGLRELVRVLRSGGRYCFLEPRRFYPTHFVNCLLHAKTEVSALKMKIGNILAWLEAAGVSDIHVSQCVYTPNRPHALVALYNRIDAMLENSTWGRHCSVMFCVHGSK